MKRSIVGCAPATGAVAWLLVASGFCAYAAAPVDLSEVAPVEDLVLEARSQLGEVEKSLEDDESYQRDERNVHQAAGVLACLGQALAEHPERSKVEAQGAELRDAALELGKSQSRADASAAFQKAKQALDGQLNSQAKTEHAWDELIEIHHLMSEVNARTGTLRRIERNLGRGRKSRNPVEDSLHATTLAVLALPIHADTHLVLEESEIPKWQGYSTDMQQSMTALAAALKQQEAEAANAAWLKGLKSCNECHETFRVDVAEF